MKLQEVIFIAFSTTSCLSLVLPEPKQSPSKSNHPAYVKKLGISSSLPLDMDHSNDLDHRHASSRKKWGIDNVHANEYWFDSRIHTLGNSGFTGAFHAAIAPLATKIIDLQAYDGVDVRGLVAAELSKSIDTTKARVIDLCCGVGFSTRALREAFPDAEAVIGVDTSAEMVAMAKFLTNHLDFVKPIMEVFSSTLWLAFTAVINEQKIKIKAQGSKLKKAAQKQCGVFFARGNAENTGLPTNAFNLVTICYGFHECPLIGRERILQEARRLLAPNGVLAILDISEDHKPTKGFLAGEPYFLEYQSHINSQLGSLEGFEKAEYTQIVSGHVGMWRLRRTMDPAIA